MWNSEHNEFAEYSANVGISCWCKPPGESD